MSAANVAGIGRVLENLGAHVLRYSLIFFLLFFGALKWTVDEARAVNPLIANSPFLSWTNHAFGVQGASELIGVIELVLALLIALRRWKPLISAWGSVFAVGMFLVTLSFLLTTPNVQQDAPFLLKDLSLLGASLWTAGEAFGAVSLSTKQVRSPVHPVLIRQLLAPCRIHASLNRPNDLCLRLTHRRDRNGVYSDPSAGC